MDAPSRQRWHVPVIVLAVVYLVVGILFAALANSSASNQMRETWRRLAFVASAAAFAAHILYELFRLRNSPRTTALHASLAVAMGAFALAVAATIHAPSAASSHQAARALALVVWPAVTAVPAFVVALAASAGLARMRRSVINGEGEGEGSVR
jgi:hypothetical protein